MQKRIIAIIMIAILMAIFVQSAFAAERIGTKGRFTLVADGNFIYLEDTVSKMCITTITIQRAEAYGAYRFLCEGRTYVITKAIASKGGGLLGEYLGNMVIPGVGGLVGGAVGEWAVDYAYDYACEYFK
jgi:hypothetical protein